MVAGIFISGAVRNRGEPLARTRQALNGTVVEPAALADASPARARSGAPSRAEPERGATILRWGRDE